MSRTGCGSQGSGINAVGTQVTVFDGDDTLWFVEPLYDRARDAARAVVSACGFDPVVWEELERRIDVDNVARFGVSRERFPRSCVDAYQQVAAEAGFTPDPEVVDAVGVAAKQVFEWDAPLAEEVVNVVEQVKEHGPVVLLTKGDPEVQQMRIARAQLNEVFDLVMIVPHKASAEFTTAVERVGGDLSQAWSIGNSIPSDINPALRIGMKAVWVDAHVWEHERREMIVEAGRMFVASFLRDVPAILRNS